MKQSVGLLSMVGVLVFVGCGQAQDDGRTPELEVAQVDEELSVNEQCDTASANVSVSGATSWTSNVTSYGSSSCAAAFIVDWSDYEPYRFVGSTFEVQRFEHNASTATSQSACEKLRMGVVAYLTETNPVMHLGTKWRWGQWVNGKCQLPTIVPQDDLSFHHTSDRRFALTARAYSKAKDSSASYALRSIKSTWVPSTAPPSAPTSVVP